MAPRAVIFGCLGPRLDRDERAFFRDADPWGFILFRRNIETPEQTRALVAEMRETVGRPATVLIDQEGGMVARLRPPQWRGWAQLRRLADAPLGENEKAEAVYWRFRWIADELAQLGIDANCAPMLDVPEPDAHSIIADRVFGVTPTAVARFGRAAYRALLEGGVYPVVKHLPGYGGATVDSHESLPAVHDDLATLGRRDFTVFRAFADAALGMTAHMDFRALDPGVPATFSEKIVRGVIRETIGFDGLLMTDDISMGALAGDLTARTGRALDAGCDLALHCNGKAEEMRVVAAAAPLLSGDGLRRSENALALRPVATSFDVEYAERRLEALARKAGLPHV